MADETATGEAITADDWGAAMAEQTTPHRRLGAAMAEQTSATSTPAEPAKPHVFEQFGAGGPAPARTIWT